MPAKSPVPAPAVVPRHFGLDWLRIGAFALLMLYHTALPFTSGDWVIKLAELEWPSYAMEFLSPWRLALLFIVAGYAARALLARRREPGAFARERTLRLIPPLLFAMALTIPPQSWVRLRAGHGYAHDYLYFLQHDAFRFASVDGVHLPGWEHLWFVFYLWLFTMVIAAASRVASPEAKAHCARIGPALATGQRLLWLPLLYFLPVRVAIAFTLGEGHGLFDDWLSDALYLPCFAFGFLLAGAPALWAPIARLWKPALALALASFAILSLVEALYPGRATPPHAMMALDRAAMAAMMWSMSLVMLRLADTWLKRDHKWRVVLGEGIFPCYIAHQTIIVLVAWWLLPFGLSPLPAFAIIAATTAAGSWLFYRVGADLPALRPLIGLAARPRRLGRRGRAILDLQAG